MKLDLDTFPQQDLPARATQLDAQAADAVHALDHDELYDFQHPSIVHKSALAGRHLAPSQAAGHPGHGPDTPLLHTRYFQGRGGARRRGECIMYRGDVLCIGAG